MFYVEKVIAFLWLQDPYSQYVVVVAVLCSIQKFYLKMAKIASRQNCNFPKLKIAKKASCWSWKWLDYFLLKDWKLPKNQVAEVESDLIISC